VSVRIPAPGHAGQLPQFEVAPGKPNAKIPEAWPANHWEACTWEAQARALELAAARSRNRDVRALRLGRGADSAAMRPPLWATLLREVGFTEDEVEREVAGVIARAGAAG
jgi:hypothetical protein